MQGALGQSSFHCFGLHHHRKTIVFMMFWEKMAQMICFFSSVSAHGDPSGRGGTQMPLGFLRTSYAESCASYVWQLMRRRSLPKMTCKKHKVLCGLMRLVGFAAVSLMRYHMCYVSSCFICFVSDCLFRYNVVHISLSLSLSLSIYIYIYLDA